MRSRRILSNVHFPRHNLSFSFTKSASEKTFAHADETVALRGREEGRKSAFGETVAFYMSGKLVFLHAEKEVLGILVL